MTIGGYDSIYVVMFAIIIGGALTFSVLTLDYWRQGSWRRDPVFFAFTLVCAAALVINVLARVAPRHEAALSVALDLAASLVPPLLLHLVSGGRKRGLQMAFYAVSGLVALALTLDDLSLVTVPFRDQIPAVMLAAAGGLGLTFLAAPNRRLRWWYGVLLGLMTAAALGSLFDPSGLVMLAPDCLLLVVFCVTLYYRERLVFFDLLIKRGAFLCFGLVALAALLGVARVPNRLTIVLVSAPLLLLAPWADGAIAGLVDRVFLRRRYTPAEAERLAISELQSAATEDDLRRRAEQCLSEVFQGMVEVQFHADSAPEVTLQPRASGIPYMSDDRRLLASLTRTLGMMLENVRFREQQQRQREREQQLRLLASRAELKALRAQINPHFLFNALNAIAGFIPSQPDLADQAIEQLAEVFRYTLRKSEKEWARVDEEAEFAAAYLRLEQARFGDRLQVSLAIDPEAGSVAVPAMCVQPLIENAVKHGASAAETRGEVGLRIRANGEMVSIEVSDNGPGFPAGFSLSGSGGHGLRNVAERIKGYYGDSARLFWESGKPTRVVLEIPRIAAGHAP
jgi:signal transduction histidine kinase